MSARIAPEAIGAMNPSATPQFRPHGAETHAIPNQPASPDPLEAHDQKPSAADILPPLPLPPDPPGTMFAAAVAAGALPPKPESPQELFLRLGGTWDPPDSDLHLTDHIA